jgi:hypothetical protein
MELATGDKRIVSPSEDDVVRELRANDEFVILAVAEQEYVQTSGGILEYRHDGRQFRARGTTIDPALIERVFLAYLAGDPGWRGPVEWTDVTEELSRLRRSARWQKWAGAATILALAAWVIYLIARHR